MEFTTLGRTGLNVSVASLGCGGGSALGLKKGKSEDHAIGIVRAALDVGVNLIDTAHVYGTEAVVGEAIKPVPRDQVVISTKFPVFRKGQLFSGDDVGAGLEQSLRDLGTDHIDVFHLHGVQPQHYEHALEIVPRLLAERDKGKFRHLGITETSPADPLHETLSKALDQDCFDVVMFAFSLMNHNARELLFPRTMKAGIGTMIMFVVRSLFSVPGRLQGDIQELCAKGDLPEWFARSDDPLGFLVHEDGADIVMDACYRYARHEAGADTILFGTSSEKHLATNVASILAPPLPQEDLAKIKDYFGHLVGVGLDLPGGK